MIWASIIASPSLIYASCNATACPPIDIPEVFRQSPILGHLGFRLDSRDEVRQVECFLGFCSWFGHIVFEDRADHAMSRTTVAPPIIWTASRRRLFIY